MFARLVALLAVTLLATQAVGGFLFFLVTPPPGLLIAHVSEVAEALRREQANPEPDTWTIDEPPDRTRLTGMEPLLAARLGVPPDDVRLWQDGPAVVPVSSLDQTTVDPVIIGGYRAALRVGSDWMGVRDQMHDPYDMLGRMGLWLLVSLVCIAPVAVLLGARLTSPITAFAEAADRLGRDPYSAPMPKNGPAEVILAITAFNEMQGRLRAYVDDRVRMVGAIAHDLRTPLTRLRLQLQALPPAARVRAEGEIGQMDRMVEGALAFVKDAAASRERAPLHLLSLVEAVADDLDVSATTIEVEDGPDPVIQGDESGLRRMVANLVGNAVRYGGRAQCRVGVDAGWAILQIDDDGPGLQEPDLERVFDPYVRLSDDEGGIGLGLSIVRGVAHAHGGEATLINREVGGLRAQVRLPLAVSTPAAMIPATVS